MRRLPARRADAVPTPGCLAASVCSDQGVVVSGVGMSTLTFLLSREQLL